MKLTPRQKEARQILNSEAKRILLYGGSRSGKTILLIRNIFIRAIKKTSRHSIFRFRFNHAKASLWYDTIPKLIKAEFDNVGIVENKQDWFYKFPNDSTVWIAGLDDKERTEKVLGNEYSTMFFNEISQISYDSIILATTRLAENSGLTNKIYFDCNPPPSTHWAYKIWIKYIDPQTNLALNKNMYQSLLMNPMDNIDNLPNGYIEETLDGLPDRQKRRFKYGEWVDDIEGALWTMKLIDQNRVQTRPEFKRIVVAVDPAVTNNPDSDETGIIVAGLGIDDHGYILADVSGNFNPKDWAERAVYNYEKWEADKIIAEANNGGDLVKVNIQTIDPRIIPQLVNASRGKITRAEPVSTLYEQGRIHHVNSFPDLEDQMTTWDYKAGDKSPDRIDALVWAIWSLMLEKKKGGGFA